jgi:hypothetical protein
MFEEFITYLLGHYQILKDRLFDFKKMYLQIKNNH